MGVSAVLDVNRSVNNTTQEEKEIKGEWSQPALSQTDGMKREEC